MKKAFILLLLLFSAVGLFAQNGPVEMATEMRSNGKIYIVVATLVVIFLGIVIYLFSIDRRISKLEKEKK